MVLKTGPDQLVRLVRPPAGHGSSPVRPIGPGSNRKPELNCLNRWFDWRTRRTSRFPSYPKFIFLPPSLCDWYPHCHLECPLAALSPRASSRQSTPGVGNPTPPHPPCANKPSQPQQHPTQIPSPHPRRRTIKLPPPPTTAKSPPTRSSPHPWKAPLSLSLPTIGKVAFHFSFLKFNFFSLSSPISPRLEKPCLPFLVF